MSNWETYLQAYREQKRLEEYQQKRVLPRPNTTKLMVVGYSALYLALMALGTKALWMLLSMNLLMKVVGLLIFVVLFTEIYGRFLGIKVVECYQHYSTERIRRKCKCIPSCSEYAILCFKKYELVHALLKIRRRLYVTCKGFEHIVDYP